MRLTKSQSDYLKAVYELSSYSSDGGVRVINISKRLNVSKAGASLAVSKLTQQGYVYKNGARHAYLTSEGERQAVSVLDKYAGTIGKSIQQNKATVDASMARCRTPPFADLLNKWLAFRHPNNIVCR